MASDPHPIAERAAARRGGDHSPLAALVDSVVGSQPLNKQPLLIAGNLEEELLSKGWPAGLRMGQEPVLARRYGVGRDVLREVVRILEARDHARMRRGPGGGLEIVRPELDDLIGRLSGYAYLTDMDRAGVLEAWVVLQAAGARLIEQNIDHDWRAIAGSLAERRDLGSNHTGERLIAASGNPILVMLGDLIAALLPPFAAQPSADGTDLWLERANCATGLLEWLRRVELPSLLSRLGSHPSERRITPPHIPRSTCFQSEAMQLVHELMSTTAPEAWMRGELIGNEFDLADRFGVDKSIVRQAIRLMEDAEVARALPGRGRGLVTRLPSTAPLSRLLCAYIVAHGGTAADGEALFRVLRMECVGAAADHATSSDKASLLAMLQDLENLTAPVPVSALQGFERLQQHVARNCLLGLSIDAVKAFLTWQMGTCPIASAEILAVYREHTRRVVTAICAGDRAAAVEAESEKLIAMSRLRGR